MVLGSDLAEQYQCANGTKSINLAIKRNIERFPSDFYFQLNEKKFNQICGFNLKLQNNKLEVSKLWYEICEDKEIFEEGIEKIKMQYDLTIKKSCYILIKIF